MRKKARRISCVFEGKKKGEELTKGGTWPLSSTETRHPLPSAGTATGGEGGGAGTSSSSGGTTIGGACGTGTSSSSDGTTTFLGCDYGWQRVGWTKNPTHEKIESGEKLHLHPHPWVKFQTRARTCRVSGTHRIC
jgi:hypothetical protein